MPCKVFLLRTEAFRVRLENAPVREGQYGSEMRTSYCLPTLIRPSSKDQWHSRQRQNPLAGRSSRLPPGGKGFYSVLIDLENLVLSIEYGPVFILKP